MSASHTTHLVLDEAEGSIRGLPSQTEGRFGSAVRGQTDLWPLVRRGVGPAHQLPRNASSVSDLSFLPARNSGTPCASTLRQQVRGVIHKSPGRPCLEVSLNASEQASCVGSEQSSLTEGDTCAGQNEPRSRHVVEEHCLFRGMDAPPTRSSDNLVSLWQRSSRLLRLRRQLSLPNLFTKSTDALAHEWPSLLLYAFPPVALLLQVLRRVREQRHKLILIAPLWRNQLWVSELFQLLKAAPWPIPLRQDLLSQAMARHGIHGPSYGPCMCGNFWKYLQNDCLYIIHVIYITFCSYKHGEHYMLTEFSDLCSNKKGYPKYSV